MSINSIQTKINQLNKQIADLLKKENGEKKKQLNISSKIYDLNTRLLKATSTSSLQNYQRQSENKHKELLRIEKKIADISKQLATKRTELTRTQSQLQKELERENKKRSDIDKKRIESEKKLIREREQSNRNQITQLRTINKEIQVQQNLFSENIYQYQSEINEDETDYEINELVELSKRIDKVLEKLNELGLGQHILFEEIEELKSKGKKISKKDLKLMLIGKIVGFGMKTIDTKTAQDIFKTITGVDMGKLLE